MPPEIPGYVYDEERRKYFKILPDHLVPSSASYSRTGVAEDQRRKEDLLERTKFRQRQWKQQIQRSVILSMHPLGGFMGVQREHGSHEGRIETANNQIWAKGLKQESFIIQGPRPLPDQSGDIRHFVHEPNTGAILYFPSWSENRSLNNAEICVPVLKRSAPPLTVERYYMDNCSSIDFSGARSEVSSLSISPDRFILATGLGDQYQPSTHMIQMNRLWEVEDIGNRPHVATTVAHFDLSNLMLRSSSRFNTIWASAAGPHQGNQNLFAVGTSNGVMLVHLWDRAMAEDPWAGGEYVADTLAVDFWGHWNVLSGMRNGKVRLWDLRSHGSNVRFQHASCVVNIKSLDRNQILVAGHKDKCLRLRQSQLCIYDARYLKAFPQSEQTEDLPPSQPVHTFPTYRRKSFVYPKLGFDVHENLIAVGAEDGRVQLFDIKSGQEIAVGTTQAYPPILGRQLPRCLKFVENVDRGGGMRLLVARGPRIDALTW